MKTITSEKGNRPLCPDCGNEPISRGTGWQCNHCGRWYNKIYRPQKFPPGLSCPECGSTKTVKNGGVRLVCRDCGNNFSRRSCQQPMEQGDVRTL